MSVQQSIDVLQVGGEKITGAGIGLVERLLGTGNRKLLRLRYWIGGSGMITVVLIAVGFVLNASIIPSLYLASGAPPRDSLIPNALSYWFAILGELCGVAALFCALCWMIIYYRSKPGKVSMSGGNVVNLTEKNASYMSTSLWFLRFFTVVVVINVLWVIVEIIFFLIQTIACTVVITADPTARSPLALFCGPFELSSFWITCGLVGLNGVNKLVFFLYLVILNFSGADYIVEAQAVLGGKTTAKEFLEWANDSSSASKNFMGVNQHKLNEVLIPLQNQPTIRRGSKIGNAPTNGDPD